MTILGERIPFGAACAAVLLALFVLIAVGAPLVAPLDPNQQDLFARLKPPGTEVRGRSTCSVPMNSGATS